jgi:hypothetical protein
VALAPRHRPPPLGHQVHSRQDRPTTDTAEHQGPGPPARTREPLYRFRTRRRGCDLRFWIRASRQRQTSGYRGRADAPRSAIPVCGRPCRGGWRQGALARSRRFR